MDLRLTGKTALVLGGSKGLGRGVADALAAEGVAVAMVARGQEALDKAVAEIKARGGRAIGIAADVADWPSIERAVSTTRQQLGPIDILLNNSGGPPPSPVSGVAPEVWEAQFRQMVLVFFRLTDLVLPDMKARKWGRIINVASESVVQPIAAIGISNTLRASVVGWAKTLAGEVGRDGITVNTLLPGPFLTDRITQVARARAQRESVDLEEITRRIGSSVPVGRIGDPAEFGAVAAFLASPLAGYITGSMIRVEGGSIRSI
ncbi:MAG TPA: SDR family oxidoreductase [Candidatus Binataceae bacterium]|nr:SDR family oxidoreductase [Candidatus Binataceae bacterium]